MNGPPDTPVTRWVATITGEDRSKRPTDAMDPGPAEMAANLDPEQARQRLSGAMRAALDMLDVGDHEGARLVLVHAVRVWGR